MAKGAKKGKKSKVAPDGATPEPVDDATADLIDQSGTRPYFQNSNLSNFPFFIKYSKALFS